MSQFQFASAVCICCMIPSCQQQELASRRIFFGGEDGHQVIVQDLPENVIVYSRFGESTQFESPLVVLCFGTWDINGMAAIDAFATVAEEHPTRRFLIFCYRDIKELDRAVGNNDLNLHSVYLLAIQDGAVIGKSIGPLNQEHMRVFVVANH